MSLDEVIGALPPLKLAEREGSQKMTNTKRLEITSMSIINDLMTGEREPHPRDYIEITGDTSDYQMCVATGQGVHGKGARLFKSSGGSIRRVQENVRSLLRFVPAPQLEDYLQNADMTQDEFVERVKSLPSVSSEQ